MHSIGPDLNSIVGERMMVGSVVLLAFAAFAMLMLVLLVKRFGAFRTFGWGFSLSLVGLMSLFAGSVQVRTTNVAYEDARTVSARPHDQLSVEYPSGDYATDVTVVSERGHGEVVAIAPVRRRIQAEEPAASAWDENIAPVANIYPGIPECGRPLAFKLVDYLREQAALAEPSPKAEVEEPPKYRIAAINRDERIEHADFLRFLINFREEFTSQMPGSTVEGVMGNAKSAPRKKKVDHSFQNVQVTVYPSFERTTSGENVQGGTLRGGVRIEGTSGQLVCLVNREDQSTRTELLSKFIEKPWVADPDMFMSQNVKQKLIIGFSPRFATSEQEARASSLKDANVRLAKSTNKIFQANYDMEKNVVDRFVQKLTMPYGSVWREAVLVDYGSPKASFQRFYGDTATAVRLARGANSVTNVGVRDVGVHGRNATRTSSKKRRATTMFSIRASPEFRIAVLMLMTIVVGWISNWMTQGYYRGRVWTVTGALFGLGFLFLILIVLFSLA